VARVEHVATGARKISATEFGASAHARPSISRVSLRSVVRIAIAMWACASFVLGLAFLFAWELLSALGVTTNVQKLARQLTNDPHFHLATGAIAFWTVVVAIAFTIVAALVTVASAAVFNGLVRMVGGVQLDVRRTDAPARGRA